MKWAFWILATHLVLQWATLNHILISAVLLESGQYSHIDLKQECKGQPWALLADCFCSVQFLSLLLIVSAACKRRIPFPIGRKGWTSIFSSCNALCHVIQHIRLQSQQDFFLLSPLSYCTVFNSSFDFSVAVGYAIGRQCSLWVLHRPATSDITLHLSREALATWKLNRRNKPLVLLNSCYF